MIIMQSIYCIQYDLHEYINIILKTIKNDIITLHQHNNNTYSNICVLDNSSINPSKLWKSSSNHRSFTIYSLIVKLRLNSLKTKFVKNIHCKCGNSLSIQHLLFNCPIILQSTHQNPSLNNIKSLKDILNSIQSLFILAKILLSSSVANLL